MVPIFASQVLSLFPFRFYVALLVGFLFFKHTRLFRALHTKPFCGIIADFRMGQIVFSNGLPVELTTSFFVNGHVRIRVDTETLQLIDNSDHGELFEGKRVSHSSRGKGTIKAIDLKEKERPICIKYDDGTGHRYSRKAATTKFGSHAHFVTCCLARQPVDDPTKQKPSIPVKSIPIVNNNCPCMATSEFDLNFDFFELDESGKCAADEVVPGRFTLSLWRIDMGSKGIWKDRWKHETPCPNRIAHRHAFTHSHTRPRTHARMHTRTHARNERTA